MEKDILLSDFICIYDDVFSPEICESLINMFDLCEKRIYDDDCKKFSEINLNKNQSFFPKMSSVVNLFGQCAEAYRRDAPFTDLMPPTMIMESIKIKKYEQDGYFNDHIDSCDSNTMMRYLSMFVYLNDSGGTDFSGNKIEAKAGRVVCFPPMWMFPHNGYVGDKPKYFMGSYLHFELPSVKEDREKKSALSSAG